MIVQIFFFILFGAHLARANIWTDCGSAAGVKLSEVKVEGCSSAPCKIKAGTNVMAKLKFSTTSAVTNPLECSVVGILPDTPMPIPFPGRPTCTPETTPNGGIGEFLYGISLTVPNEAPKAIVKGKFSLDDGEKQIVCFEIGMDLNDTTETTNNSSKEVPFITIIGSRDWALNSNIHSNGQSFASNIRSRGQTFASKIYSNDPSSNNRSSHQMFASNDYSTSQNTISNNRSGDQTTTSNNRSGNRTIISNNFDHHFASNNSSDNQTLGSNNPNEDHKSNISTSGQKFISNNNSNSQALTTNIPSHVELLSSIDHSSNNSLSSNNSSIGKTLTPNIYFRDKIFVSKIHFIDKAFASNIRPKGQTFALNSQPGVQKVSPNMSLPET